MKNFIFAILLTIASPVYALTFVQIPDHALLNQADTVLEGQIKGFNFYITQSLDQTIYRVVVSRYLKGSGASEINLRVPGSMGSWNEAGSNSDELVISGMPRFKESDEVLLFLSLRSDGAYDITQSALGVFWKYDAVQGNATARRQLLGSYELPGNGLGAFLPAADQVRNWEGFAQWLQGTAAGASLVPGYWDISQPGDEPTSDNFKTLGSPSRWFEFDSAQNVTQLANASGQTGLTGGGYTEFQSGITAWDADAASNILYLYGGTTSARGGMRTSDGTNTILFNDPNNEISGSFNCSSGGVLAVGGYWTSGVGSYNGTQFRRIRESDIVVQDGAGCFLNANAGTNAAEVFGHELGHTLGLGHSCGDAGDSCSGNPVANQALMRAFVHADRRGATLTLDDSQGAAFLYGASMGGGEAPPSSGGSGGNSSSGGGVLDPLLLMLWALAARIGWRSRLRLRSRVHY